MSLTQKLGKRGRYVKLSICHIIDNKGRANLPESPVKISAVLRTVAGDMFSKESSGFK